MIIRASQQNTRQTPRKVRLVANTVKGMSIESALRQLAVIERRASILVLKVIRQALANAEHNHGITADKLTLKSIIVENGPHMKRFRAVSRGRAHTILKKTCHVVVELESKEKEAEVEEVKEPVKKEIASKAKTTKTKKTAKKIVKKQPKTEKDEQ
ncbi:MAG: 50S ribosomal protein L22 [Candidatus Pacebacteria bacterium CG_4_10_14_0_8_um_filter_42_14]|nr:MAG: 50S ribosomal protein L22 [Candidatus Pacebacteria bacterium CG_4_10_14_0_8_um_filter_42_14]